MPRFVLLLCALGLAACGRATAEGPASGLGQVRRRTVEDVFFLTGELQAVRSTALTVPRVEGFRVQIKWLAEDGAEVQPGQTVAELDTTQAAQGLEEKRSRVVQAQIELDQLQATLAAEAAQKRADLQAAEVEAGKARIEAAVPQELRSRKEWHEKQQALRKAEAELEKARLGLAASGEGARAQLEGLRLTRDKAARDAQAAEAALGSLRLVAPRPGLVMLNRHQQEDRPLQAGDNLFPGMRLASMPDLTSMEVVASLASVDEGRVQAGQPARVVLDSDLAHAFAARVEEVAAVAEETRTANGFRVRVTLLQELASTVRPGLSARVEVVRRTFKDALVVPRPALVRREGRWQARSPGGGFRDVRIATCLALDCVVESGLQEGDRVALR